MISVKVLHLASFQGNVGDNANHNGFYSAISTIKDYAFSFTTLEIRDFFWKDRFFDENLVEYINSFDLFVFGGGNYFELWVDHSPTGTSFMMTNALFERIDIPIIFNCLGVDPAQGTSTSAVSKFKNFLDTVQNKNNSFLSVRNDGSFETLGLYLGDHYQSIFYHAVDAGCNLRLDNCPDNNFLFKHSKYVCINLAGDMLERRFAGNIQFFQAFLRDFAQTVQSLIEDSLVDEIVLVPHILADIDVLYQFSKMFDYKLQRQKLTFAPLLHGQGCEVEVFKYYKYSAFNICNRFHANLCSIAFEKPTLMLYNYRQIKKLAEETSLQDFLVPIESGSIASDSKNLIRAVALNPSQFAHPFIDASSSMRSRYMSYISELSSFLDDKFKPFLVSQ
ncbi:hypothetical protein OAK57_03160 [Synechococcus sp. AH-551-N23]|nr:hypothetical protein [Synechococcus sp. AH-551-N23]